MRRHKIARAETAAAPLVLACALLLASCHTIQSPPMPLDPVMSAMRVKARTLDDPSIIDALGKMGLSASAGWNLDALTVAAWNIRSDIAVAAADVAEGMAAERVAGLKPNPTLNVDGSGFVTNNLGDPSPWVFAAGLGFTIETHGKREIRVAQAQADTETRRWRLAETLWLARSDLRKAILARNLALNSIALAEEEIALRENYLDFVQTQLRFGAGLGSDLLTAQTNLSRAQVQLRTARTELATAEGLIAAAESIPIENLPLARLSPVSFETLPAPEAIDPGTLRDFGLVNRLTVRHALADYAVTEQALRAAVARQYPDYTIGPGYTFDRGDHALTFASNLIVPLIHDERDAIAQAVDVRARAAAQFQVTQTQALGEIDAAGARYRAAYAAFMESKTVEIDAQATVSEVQRRLEAGGADRGEVLTAQINLAQDHRASLDALRAATDALGALEDGVQRPVWPESTLAIQRPDGPSRE